MAVTRDTASLLAARYGLPIIPLEAVCRDFFTHLTPRHFAEKAARGEIALPLVSIDRSKKAARGVPLADLAAYLDSRIEEARQDCHDLNR